MVPAEMMRAEDLIASRPKATFIKGEVAVNPLAITLHVAISQ